MKKECGKSAGDKDEVEVSDFIPKLSRKREGRRLKGEKRGVQRKKVSTKSLRPVLHHSKGKRPEGPVWRG